MDELTYKGDGVHTYAMSIAATWVWAPAVFVASNMAYYSGLYGFLWFLIPNVLTLLVFGYFAHKFVNERGQEYFVGMTDLFENNKRQANLHSIVSSILLVSSGCVQIIGLHTLLQVYFPTIPIWLSACLISVFCYLYSKHGGIKWCIITDKLKYIIMLLIGIALVCISFSNANVNEITFFGVNNPNFWDITISFGIISTIGLLCAPYVDNTFWQRVFCLEEKTVTKTFKWSALYFLLIPLCFGLVGFLSTPLGEQGWVITKAFGDNQFVTGMLSVAITCALVSTLDSCLCAADALSKKTINIPAMEVMLLLSCIIVILLEPTIVQMFLAYGTIRTAIAVPTILTIYNKSDESRLFYATLCAVLVGGGGYLIISLLGLPYGFIFTIFALLFPLLGFKR